ncbi:MAG: MBL fold metallo-hydrolase [Gemmatimonadetes bacterium]|nr:MBL fold metallo-hydrolase [Gemmatimonadota bacterium]
MLTPRLAAFAASVALATSATHVCAQQGAPRPATPAPGQPPAPLGPGELRLTYLGNAGWEITDGRRVVLVDPFLTQFARWRPGAAPEGPDPNALYAPDTTLINQHVSRADYVLITHGHSDHALDAGYIARKTGAAIIGSETAANLARAYAVPEQQLITVRGGEDYDFDDFSLRVIPSIHSALDDKRYFSNGRDIAGTAPRGLKAPLRRRDYQEGGSFAYLLRMSGHEVLMMGSMNFIEREMVGLRPNVALVGANSQRLEIYDFTGRLLRALGHPALVIPSHADAYGNPRPPAAVLADRAKFFDEVRAASPGSRTIAPTWFTPIVVPARGAAMTAASTASGREVINPPGLKPLVPAYSVAIRDGDWVFVSGMTGVKPGTQDIIEGGAAVQTRQTMENIKAAVESGGATMADVAECTVYLKDMADYAAMNAEYIKFFPVNPPARATLAVTAMPRPAAVVEIKCSARRTREATARPDAPAPNAAAANPTAPEAQAVTAGAGARSFVRALALEDSGFTSANASIGDVNRDGHLDIVLVKGRHWPLQNLVMLGNGNGTFQKPLPVDTAADRSYSGVLVDLDRDGALDIVVSNDAPDEKKVYRNDGTGRFALVSKFGKPEWNTRHVAVGDVSGDGIPDLVLANRGSREPTASFLCLGLGGGRIAERCQEVSRGSATTITMADVNRDGSLDLIVPYRDGGQGYVYFNDGRGTFARRQPFGPDKATIRSAYAADFDGDGIMDLAAIDELGSAMTMNGLRGGAFAAPVLMGPAGARPYALAVHDVDGNGRPDVLVGYTRGRSIVFFNDAPGRFTPVPFGGAEGVVYGFAVADLDKDGKNDIVVARSDARNMVYFGKP